MSVTKSAGYKWQEVSLNGKSLREIKLKTIGTGNFWSATENNTNNARNVNFNNGNANNNNKNNANYVRCVRKRIRIMPKGRE
jgi:hypothetical protein